MNLFKNKSKRFEHFVTKRKVDEVGPYLNLNLCLWKFVL